MRFSIIVPVYGVEKYLEECVESLLCQTFSDFEIILVDDKSPDRSPQICDELSARDARIKVIHKEKNEGLGFARNTGMAAAEGEYILFVDSDDTIDSKTLELCNDALLESPDVLVFGMEMRYEDKSGATKWTEAIFPREEFLAETDADKASMFSRLSYDRVFNYVCNKAYNREFLLKAATRFEQTKLIEDFLFNIEIFGKAKTIKCIPEYFYFYRKPAHTTLASKPDPAFFSLCKRKYLLEEEFLTNCGSLERYGQDIKNGYLKHIVSVVLRNKSAGAELTGKAQKEKAKEMICDPLTVRVLEDYKPDSSVYKVIGKLIKNKKVDLLLLVCSFIGFAQYKLKPILQKIR